MQCWRRTALAAVTVVATGCASASVVGDRAQPRPVQPRAVQSSTDPSKLIGSWYLDAAGEPHGTIVTIGDRVDGGLLMFRSCGMLSGDWRANRQAMFVGELDGGDGACFNGREDWSLLRPHWLTAATAFAAAGRNATLLDAQGNVLATLRPGAHPTVGTDDSPDYVKTPVVTPQMRNSWREPSPLPDGVRAISSADLMHRWVPDRAGTSRAYVSFGAGGRYTGSDGCNGQAGRYLLGSHGVVLATSGASTAIGCENSPLPSWVAQAGRLGVRNHRLVFVSPDGAVLGTAARAA